MVKYLKNYSSIAWLVVITKFVLLSVALVYVDRFNSDMIENIYWGQEWQAGYYKHPPMFAWISEIWMQIFKNNVRFYHLLTAVVFSLPSYLNFVLFKKILDEKKAILGVILIEGIVYSNFVNICFNANTLLFIFHPIICIFAYKICEQEKGKMLDWVLFGLFSGCALLTKYSSGLVILGCGLYIIYVKKTQFLKEVGFYLASGLCLLIFSAHVYWIMSNEYLTFQYMGDQMHDTGHNTFILRISHTFDLLKALLLNSLPFLIAVLFIIKKPFLNKVKVSDKKSVFVLLISIIPFFLMTAVGGVLVKDQWMIAHVFLLPACFLWFVNTDLTKKRFIGCVSVIAIFFITVTVYLIIAYKNAPRFRDQIFNIYLDSQRETYVKFSSFINEKWTQKYNKKPKYICSRENIAGLISMYSRERNIKLHVIPNCNLYASRWIDADDLLKEGLIVISQTKIPNLIQQSIHDVKTNDELKAYEIYSKPDLIEEYLVNDTPDSTIFVYFYR